MALQLWIVLACWCLSGPPSLAKKRWDISWLFRVTGSAGPA